MATKLMVESIVRGLCRTTNHNWQVEWLPRNKTKGRINLEKSPGYPAPQTPWMSKKELVEWIRAYRLGWLDAYQKYFPLLSTASRLVNRLHSGEDQSRTTLAYDIEEWRASLLESEKDPGDSP